jgi:flagellar biosynthesis/type III secretory pathway ATPase
LLTKLHSQSELESIQKIVKMIARLKREKDFLLFGGTPDTELRKMLELEQVLHSFLNQRPREHSSMFETNQQIKQLADQF